MAEYGVVLSEAAIRKQAASAPGKSPVKSGRKVLPAKFDKALVDLCVEMREMRLPIIKFMIIGKLEPDGAPLRKPETPACCQALRAGRSRAPSTRRG